jgi:hypothetical protein
MNRQRHVHATPSPARARRLAVGAAAGAVGLTLVLASGNRPQESGADLDGTRALLEKYVEVRGLISKERRDWTLEQDLLAGRADLLRTEIDQFRERIAEIEGSIGESDKKREELAERNERLIETSSGLEDVVAELEARTRALVERLPEPAADKVQLLSQQIPVDPEDTELTLGRRFQNVIGVLNELNRFNRTVSVFSELVVNSNGEEVEASTIHVGLGRAYYVTVDGEFAGHGPARVEPGSPWEWEPRNDAAAAVDQAIAIMKDEAPAAFVRLPITVEIPNE